jgi:hypothetical protein
MEAGKKTAARRAGNGGSGTGAAPKVTFVAWARAEFPSAGNMKQNTVAARQQTHLLIVGALTNWVATGIFMQVSAFEWQTFSELKPPGRRRPIPGHFFGNLPINCDPTPIPIAVKNQLFTPNEGTHYREPDRFRLLPFNNWNHLRTHCPPDFPRSNHCAGRSSPPELTGGFRGVVQTLKISQQCDKFNRAEKFHRVWPGPARRAKLSRADGKGDIVSRAVQRAEFGRVGLPRAC